MPIELKQLKRKPNKSIMIGEPVRASSHFYATAVEFRDLLDQLGVQVSSITRELVLGTIPVLKSFLLAQGDGDRDRQTPSKLELKVVMQVTYEDGKTVVFSATDRRESAVEVAAVPKVVKSRHRHGALAARKSGA